MVGMNAFSYYTSTYCELNIHLPGARGVKISHWSKDMYIISNIALHYRLQHSQFQQGFLVNRRLFFFKFAR